MIRFEQMADRKQQSAVAAGRADLVDITWNDLPYGDLAVRYPTRLLPGVKVFTTGLFLNTRQPPFTNLKARQAINYAIDRGRVIQILQHGPGQAAATCQILPTDFPSYQRYCPYTAGAKDGFWHGPDLTKARQLAKESGTTDVPVTVWNYGGKPLGTYLVQLLRRLGYRATLRDVSYIQFYALPAATANKIQIGFTSWAADYPTASDYFLPLLTCTSPLNQAQYCNPHVDKLVREAQQVQLINQAAARKLWARVQPYRHRSVSLAVGDHVIPQLGL